MSNYDTSALAIALAALGKNGSGSGGTGSGTVSVIVAGTETIEPGNPAQVLNLGDQENVELYFYIPAGEDGTPGTPGAPVLMVKTEVNFILQLKSLELLLLEW